MAVWSIVRFNVLLNYQVEVSFADGTTGMADLAPRLSQGPLGDGDVAEQLQAHVALVEATENADLREVLAKECRGVLLAFDGAGALSQVVKRALRVLKSFNVTMKPDGSFTLGLDIEPEHGLAYSGILADDMGDLLQAVVEAARDRSSGFVLAIDEVQYLQEAELAALITAIHRCAQRALPIVLVGAGLPQLPALAGNAKSYAERLFTFPRIDSLPAGDEQLAVTRPAQEQQVVFDEAAVELIVRETHGYPYFLQEWAYETWNVAAGSPIRLSDVATAGPRILQKLDENFFRVRFDRLTPAEKRYLGAMAQLGPEPQRSGDIAQRYGAKVESVAPMRSALIKKGMIYSPSHGDTAFTVPLFDQFLRRTMDLPQR